MRKVRYNWKKIFIWSAPILLVKESYIIVLISALINLDRIEFQTVGEAINTVSCFLSLTVLLVIPILVYKFLSRNKDNLNSKLMLQKYGSLYTGLRKTEVSDGVMQFATYQYIRRAALAVSIVWLRWFLVIQFLLFAMSSIT